MSVKHASADFGNEVTFGVMQILVAPNRVVRHDSALCSMGAPSIRPGKECALQNSYDSPVELDRAAFSAIRLKKYTLHALEKQSLVYLPVSGYRWPEHCALACRA